jgi:HEAT repeat protein
VYIEALDATRPRPLAVAIDGIGETGSHAEADRVAPFLGDSSPRVRRAALRALAKLDAERAIPAALAAIADDASSVRTAAVRTLSSNADRVDFDVLKDQVLSLSDAKARQNLLRLFLEAPKWDAPAFLLEALTDSDDGVRALAARLLDRWIERFKCNQTQPTTRQVQRIGALLAQVASRIPKETARMLRFSIEAC